MSSSTSSAPSRRELLANKLIDCAALVRRAERGPLIADTIQELIEYNERPARNRASATNARGSVSSASSSQQQTTEQQKQRRAAEAATLAKPIKPPHVTNLIGKVVGHKVLHEPTKSEGSKRATSTKNATRIRNELKQQQQQQQHGSAAKSTWFGGHEKEGEWCDEHFCMGCACKERAKPHNSNNSTATATTTTTTTVRSKPAFYRPTNPKSSLIANGWIEQHRRSKMRTVWKDVLASLVEGRKPGEETTLWIQREVPHGSTGKPELEALHQIPAKWIEQVIYTEHEHKFSIKVYNWTDEFVFRCPNNLDAAQNWVLTLRSIREIAQRPQTAAATTRNPKFPKKDYYEEKKVEPTTVQQQKQQQRISNAELIAIAHGEGISTVGMERADLERIVAELASAKSMPPATTVATAPTTVETTRGVVRPVTPPLNVKPSAPMEPTTMTASTVPLTESTSADAAETVSSNTTTTTTTSNKLKIKELRAIAHGAGIHTVGMERGELEAAVARLAAGAQQQPPEEEEHRRQVEQARKAEEARQREEKAKKEAEKKKKTLRQAEGKNEESSQPERETEVKARAKAIAEEDNNKRREAEEAKRKAEEAAAAAKQQRQQEEAHRQRIAEQVKQRQEKARMQKEEEERKRMEAERLQREEEEHQNRLAEQRAAELARQQEEAVRQQQQQWQQQQAEVFRRQQEYAAQQQQAEALRRQQAQQYAAQQQQQYAAQQQQQHHWQQTQQHHWQQTQQHPQTHPHWQQPQPHGPHPQHAHWQQQQQPHAPHPQQPHFPQQQQHAQVPPHHGQPPPGSSPINQKYAQMAHQTENTNQLSEQGIKHGILVEWALQPPMLQVLRPIEELLCTIHMVFPPKFGIPKHDYFSKWETIQRSDVCNGLNLPDDDKLKKIVRKKLRFFLHPDKLPSDLTTEQTFVCKLLWDITTDAWKEHEEKKEDLDWVKG